MRRWLLAQPFEMAQPAEMAFAQPYGCDSACGDAVRAEAASSLRMRTGSPLQMRELLLLKGRCPMACPDGTMHPAEMALGFLDMMQPAEWT